MDSLRFSSKQNQLIIKTVLLDAPYAKVMIAEDKRTNIGDIVVTKQNDTSKASTNATMHATTKATVTTKGNSSNLCRSWFNRLSLPTARRFSLTTR